MPERVGDLLDCDADVIVQQCNCLTRRALGLSAAIAERLGVNPYAEREGSGNVASAASPAQPGTVSLHAVQRPLGQQQHVACLYAQYAPGTCRKRYAVYDRVKQERSVEESAELRERWFAQCLEALAAEMQQRGLRSVALPHGIGCGLAGGAWPRYRALIDAWARAHPALQVAIVQLPPATAAARDASPSRRQSTNG